METGTYNFSRLFFHYSCDCPYCDCPSGVLPNDDNKYALEYQTAWDVTTNYGTCESCQCFNMTDNYQNQHHYASCDSPDGYAYGTNHYFAGTNSCPIQGADCVTQLGTKGVFFK